MNTILQYTTATLDEQTLITQKIFGANLASLIRASGKTIQECAKQIHYGRSDLSLVIRGKKNITLQTAAKIAQHFDLSLFLLFTRQFDQGELYRRNFPFIETNYLSVYRKNFITLKGSQSKVELDPSTCWKLLSSDGGHANPTVKTLCAIAAGANASLAELLKTNEDKRTEKKLKEATE